MDKAQYLIEQEKLKIIVPILLSMNLEEMAAAQERAEALGPILDPTLYRDRARDFSIDMRVTRALLKAKLAIETTLGGRQ